MAKNFFNGQWRAIMSDIQRRWENVNEDDLRKTDGNINKISDLLNKEYGMSRNLAKKKVNEIISHIQARDPLHEHQRNFELGIAAAHH